MNAGAEELLGWIMKESERLSVKMRDCQPCPEGYITARMLMNKHNQSNPDNTRNITWAQRLLRRMVNEGLMDRVVMRIQESGCVREYAYFKKTG